MNVLSLFDGMSCGQIALNRIGINPNKYYASEVEKPPITVTQANYPDTIQLGDVTKWREWDIDWSSIDLVMGGSPCQGFSIAGLHGGTRVTIDEVEQVVETRDDYLSALDKKRNGHDVEFKSQSYLFWEFVLCLDHVKAVNPKVKFLLENVKMSGTNESMITRVLGVNPVSINSNLVAPYDRPRLYWCNWPADIPEQVNVYFCDVVGTDVVQMGEGWHKWWFKNREFQLRKKYSKVCKLGDKGICLTARQYASWNGNFIEIENEVYAKPNKQALARLIGANDDYLNSVSQRQAEEMTGNGWTVDVIAHILRAGLLQ